MDAFTDLVGHSLRLHPDGYRMLASGQVPAWWGVRIPLLAALSQGIAHAFILFVNRVTPIRFALSLVVEAILLVVGFLFWALSTWLVTRLAFAVPVRPALPGRALAHAALPVDGDRLRGGPVEVAGLGGRQAFTALLGGWLVMLLLQRRAGQPLMRLGRGLLNRTAGVQLVHDRRALRALLASAPPGRPPR
jgi:ethanolamine transporter EutH